MKKYLFIIESPFQLLSAYEAIIFFKIDVFDVYIRYSFEDGNDKQINKILDIMYHNIKVKKLFIRTKNKKKIDYLKILFYIISIRICSRGVNKVFLGNLESGFLSKFYKCFPNKKIIALDDGSITLNTQKKFTENNFCDVFSMYDLEPINNQIIFQNKFRYIKENILKVTKEDTVIFLGSKLNELGIISEEYYLLLIKKISNYFNERVIFYIPHRGEDMAKIKKISNIKNIVIKETDYPIELYGLYQNIIPSTVASFYSTALYSMKIIYGLETVAFNFNYSASIYKGDIDDVYSLYKKNMDIIDIS